MMPQAVTLSRLQSQNVLLVEEPSFTGDDGI